MERVRRRGGIEGEKEREDEREASHTTRATVKMVAYKNNKVKANFLWCSLEGQALRTDE